MAHLYTNNANTTLAATLAIAATSCTLTTGAGAKFPSPTGGDDFLATLSDPANPETKWEVIKVTARAGDVLTIVKAQDGTSDQAWAIGDRVELRIPAQLQREDITLNNPLLASEPAAPIATDVQLFARRRGIPALFLQQIGGALAKRIQHGLDSIRVGVIHPENSTTAPQRLGTQFSAPTTLSSYTPTSTDYVSSTFGQILTSTAVANAICGWRETTQPSMWRGNAAGRGGFLFHCRVTLVTVDAGAAGKDRAFFGITSLGTGTDMCAAEPSSNASSFIGIGYDGTDLNVQLMRKDGTTAVKVDTGQVRTTTLQMWDLWLFSEPNGSVIYVYLDKIIGDTRTNVLNTSYSTNIPLNTAFMGHQMQVGPGSGPGAASVWRFNRLYYECF